MNNDIRESIGRLQQLPTGDLAATSDVLTTLLAALRKEITSRSGELAGVDHFAFVGPAGELTTLLQLTNAVIQAKAELDKLTTAAGKAIQRVLKKAPK